MLECGINYKGTQKEWCDICSCYDDENHRMNKCPKWREHNFYDDEEKIDFNLVYSHDIDVLRYIIKKINVVWNTHNAHGTMNTN